jgi:hypothetical protein
VSVRTCGDTNIKYLGHHFGASMSSTRSSRGDPRRPPAEIPLDEGLRAVATGMAAHRSIDEGRVVALSELLPGQG